MIDSHILLQRGNQNLSQTGERKKSNLISKKSGGTRTRNSLARFRVSSCYVRMVKKKRYNAVPSIQVSLLGLFFPRVCLSIFKWARGGEGHRKGFRRKTGTIIRSIRADAAYSRYRAPSSCSHSNVPQAGVCDFVIWGVNWIKTKVFWLFELVVLWYFRWRFGALF